MACRTISFNVRRLLKDCNQYRQMYVRTVVNLSYKIIEYLSASTDDVPIILLHDLLSNKKQWDSLGKTIHTMTKRPVVTIDLRNHGKSPHANSNKYEEMSEDVLGLLDKLSVKRAHFLGHGIGGKTAMVTALLAPQKVAGMIVVDTSPASSPLQFNDMYSNVMKSMSSLTFKGDKKFETAKFSAKKHLKSVVSDDTIIDIVLSNMILKSDHTIGWSCNLEVLMKYFNDVTTFPRFKHRKYYGSKLFIGGQFSECLPPDDLISIRRLFPRAVITYIANVGHNLQIDDPKRFLELIIPSLRCKTRDC